MDKQEFKGTDELKTAIGALAKSLTRALNATSKHFTDKLNGKPDMFQEKEILYKMVAMTNDSLLSDARAKEGKIKRVKR